MPYKTKALDELSLFSWAIEKKIEPIFYEMPEHNYAVDLGNIPFSTKQSHEHCIFS